MELTHEEVERYLNIIFTKQSIAYVRDIELLLRQPTALDKMRASHIYDRSYKKAIDQGLLSVKDLQKVIDERNVFSEADRNKLEGLRSKLYAQEVLLSKTNKVRAKQDAIKERIKGLKNEISNLEFKRTSKLSMSADSKSEEERALYLCWACVYTEKEGQLVRFWNSYEDILNERDLELKDLILIEFLKFKAGIDTEIIRFIARHSLWRIRYITSQKTTEQLFGVPTSEYTDDMLNLAYWSNFYQSVYEMLPKDRPPDSVIEDDQALDAYMKSYYEERNREDAIERNKGKNKSKLSAFDQDEVIVTRTNELYEEIDYDKPREAQRIKEKTDLKSKSKKGRKVRR